jgi:hypothetical protein
MWGTLSEERTGLSFVGVIIRSNVSCQYVQYVQFIRRYII